MYFLIGLLIFNMLVLGINFCFLIIGGSPFKINDSDSDPDPNIKVGKKTYNVERFSVGISVLALGVSWLAAWFYFLITGWSSFIHHVEALLPHVSLQFASAILLIVASVGIFKKWKRHRGLFLTSIAVLLLSIVIAVVVYGPEGHGSPMFMYLFAAWTFVVGGVFTTGTYFLGRLINDWEK